MTSAARAMADRKTFGHLSYLVATRRQSLSLPNMISILFGRHKRCNRIATMFGRRQDLRLVATRHDRCPNVFLSALALDALVLY